MFKRLTKKAEMAIGTLIIFIAMVLVAAIAAGVIIQTATALQNKALLTGERAKSQVGTGIETILVYGEDGDDKDLESFYIKLKLSPGSDALKFDDMLMGIDTERSSLASLYGERVWFLSNTSWYELDIDKVDFNQDEEPDYVKLHNSTHLAFNVSNHTAGSFIMYEPLAFPDEESQSLASASTASPVELEVYDGELKLGDERFGTYQITGKTTSNSSFTEETLLIVGQGSSIEQGAYAVDYLLKGSTWKDGYLQRGDVVKIVLIAPHTIGEDEEIDVRLIPKTGAPRTLEIVVPDLVNAKRVYMFS
ncbi:MAG: archaellin/type IV pilin N-terminal domain-containing protein [Nanoarchaeota archaeon]